MLNERRFAERAAMFSALAEDCLAALRQDLSERERTGMLLSGGASPVPLFEALSEKAFPWERVDIALMDERWVGVDDSRSNEGLLRRHLLKNRASGARVTGMKIAGTVQDAEAECERRYRALAWPMSLAVLGMGEDGHTASWFPQTSALAELLAPDGTRYCASALAPGTACVERMTVTGSALKQCRRIFLLLIGEEKWRVYQAAKAGDDVLEMPIRHVVRQADIPLHVYWAP